MKREIALKHEFVEFIPDDIKEKTIYVSIPFATAVHKCCCGCGREVVTPLSPTDWKLTFDGKTISLDPSIGNWSFQCQSHYWIRCNRARWAPRMSPGEIEFGRTQDRYDKQRYFHGKPTTTDGATTGPTPPATKGVPAPGRLQRAKRLWRRKPR